MQYAVCPRCLPINPKFYFDEMQLLQRHLHVSISYWWFFNRFALVLFAAFPLIEKKTFVPFCLNYDLKIFIFFVRHDK